MKDVWQSNAEAISALLADDSITTFDARVPVEILVPGAPDEATVQDFSDALIDICAARNNNAEVKERGQVKPRRLLRCDKARAAGIQPR